MPFMPFMPCHRQTPLSAYKFALNCHAMPVGRFWEVQKVQIQTQFLFWNHALGKERFSKAVQRLLFMILSIVFLALFERPLWTFPKSRHRLMGLCVSGSDLKRVTRLRHPVAPGTWESHQVWSSVEEADSSSAPVALGLADSRILSHKWHKCLKSSLKMIMISEDIWRCEMCPIFSSFGVYQLWTLVRLVQLVLWDHEGLLWKDFWCRWCLRNIHWPDRWS